MVSLTPAAVGAGDERCGALPESTGISAFSVNFCTKHVSEKIAMKMEEKQKPVKNRNSHTFLEKVRVVGLSFCASKFLKSFSIPDQKRVFIFKDY